MADCWEQLTEGERSFCLPQQPDLFVRMTDWGKSLLMFYRKGTTGYCHSGCVSTGKTARKAGTQQFGCINFWQCILVHSGANLPPCLFVGAALQLHIYCECSSSSWYHMWIAPHWKYFHWFIHTCGKSQLVCCILIGWMRDKRWNQELGGREMRHC